MTHEEFNEVYYPRYNSVIKAIARKLAIGNDALADDLYQEGLLALWLCNPAAAVKNPDAYVRQAIRFRMIDYMRLEKVSQFDSLDYHLEKGKQVVRGDDGRERMLRCGLPSPVERHVTGDGTWERSIKDDDDEEWT